MEWRSAIRPALSVTNGALRTPSGDGGRRIMMSGNSLRSASLRCRSIATAGDKNEIENFCMLSPGILPMRPRCFARGDECAAGSLRIAMPVPLAELRPECTRVAGVWPEGAPMRVFADSREQRRRISSLDAALTSARRSGNPRSGSSVSGASGWMLERHSGR
jgi:hypothetical protein